MMRRSLGFVALLALAACSNTSTYPSNGSLIPGTQLRVSPGYTLPVEKIVYWGAAAAVAYYVIDPLAPNWEIEEAAFPKEQYRLSLRMKKFHKGGDGEARAIFNRRADELMRKGGFDGYQIVDYSEGLDSAVLGSQRVAQGVIALTCSDAQGCGAPARNNSPSSENPRS